MMRLLWKDGSSRFKVVCDNRIDVWTIHGISVLNFCPMCDTRRIAGCSARGLQWHSDLTEWRDWVPYPSQKHNLWCSLGISNKPESGIIHERKREREDEEKRVNKSGQVDWLRGNRRKCSRLKDVSHSRKGVVPDNKWVKLSTVIEEFDTSLYIDTKIWISDYIKFQTFCTKKERRIKRLFDSVKHITLFVRREKSTKNYGSDLLPSSPSIKDIMEYSLSLCLSVSLSRPLRKWLNVLKERKSKWNLLGSYHHHHYQFR